MREEGTGTERGKEEESERVSKWERKGGSEREKEKVIGREKQNEKMREEGKERGREGENFFLFNDALNTFYLQMLVYIF